MSLAVGTLSLDSNEQQVSTVLKQVRESFRAGAGGQRNFSGLHENVMQLENLIFSLDQDGQKAITVLESLTPEALAATNEVYCFWQKNLESQFAHRLISGKASLADYFLYHRFDSLVRRELALASVPRPRRTLFIGSGPLPLSALLIHLQTGGMVDCVARNASDIAISRQVLEKCGFSHSVRILCGLDEDHEVCGYDLVLIGLLVQPKKNLLKILLKRCQKECRILCRTSLGLRQLVYQPTADRDLRGFHLDAQQVASGMQTISTYRRVSAAAAGGDFRLSWLQGTAPQSAAQILRLMNRTLEDDT